MARRPKEHRLGGRSPDFLCPICCSVLKTGACGMAVRAVD